MIKFKKITLHNILLFILNTSTVFLIFPFFSENISVYIKLALAVSMSLALAGAIYYLLSLFFQGIINNYDAMAQKQLSETLGTLYVDSQKNNYLVSPENFEKKFAFCAEHMLDYDLKELLKVYSLRYMINEDHEFILAVLPFTETGIFGSFDVVFRKPYAIEAYTNADNKFVIEIRDKPRKIPE